MKKTLLVIVLVAAVAGGIYLVTRKPVSDTATQSTPESSTTTPAAEAPASTASTKTVTYNGSTYSPASVTIKPGDKVAFVNQSSSPMHVASAPHPAHTDFSQFDAKRAYTQGQTYTFTFGKAGEFEYHNHLNSGITGVVIVE